MARVSRWRRRFAQGPCAGLSDAPRPGQPVKYRPESEKRPLAQLDSPPPRGYAAWNGRLLAQTLAVSTDWVWSTLRRHKISLQRRRSWCISPTASPKRFRSSTSTTSSSTFPRSTNMLSRRPGWSAKRIRTISQASTGSTPERESPGSRRSIVTKLRNICGSQAYRPLTAFHEAHNSFIAKGVGWFSLSGQLRTLNCWYPCFTDLSAQNSA